MKQSYLFAFSIGPVQSFIAQARKLQDLYAGSRLLSDLIDLAISHLGPDTILVSPSSEAQSKPNRLVALVQHDDISRYGSALESAVRKGFLQMALDLMGAQRFAKGEAQLRDLLEIFWAAVPYDESQLYQPQYQKLEQALGAVKNYRPFKPWKEQGRKCSVNGFYNALYYRPFPGEADQGMDQLQRRKFLCPEAEIVKPGSETGLGELQAGEGICAPTMLKRLYEGGRFPSVATVALMHLLECEEIKKNPGFQEWLIYDGKRPNQVKEFNAQLLYAENHTQEYFDEQDIRYSPEEATKRLRIIQQVAKDLNLKFLKYYAAIVFDADNMGQQLSQCPDPQAHRALSGRLAAYAAWAKEYVDQEGRGVTVYAGGDDYLGLLNLQTLFPTLEALRKEFGVRFAREGMTFSAGIAIGHYRAPLAEVLRHARHMEHRAKAQPKKNAFGVAVLKHSGEIHETVLSWNQKESDCFNTELLQLIFDRFRDGVSPAFIKNLSEVLGFWEDDPVSFRPQSDFEISRLIRRSSVGIDQRDRENLVKAVQSLYGQVALTDQSNENFITALNIADFINRKL